MTPSFSGLGHQVLTLETGVRLPSGSPITRKPSSDDNSPSVLVSRRAGPVLGTLTTRICSLSISFRSAGSAYSRVACRSDTSAHHSFDLEQYVVYVPFFAVDLRPDVRLHLHLSSTAGRPPEKLVSGPFQRRNPLVPRF